MRQALAIAIAGAVLASCAGSVPPEVLQQWQSKTLYTCCNIHYEDPAKIVDANFYVGSTLPFGTAVAVQKMTTKSVSFRAQAGDFTVSHIYGTEQETAQQYFAKILVDTDPRARFDTFSPSVQEAVREGRVEQGMTREQVIMSLGYPPTHRTPSTELTTWTYWLNRWKTFDVLFDEKGFVMQIVGEAPTGGVPVQQATAAAPKPAGNRPKR